MSERMPKIKQLPAAFVTFVILNDLALEIDAARNDPFKRAGTGQRLPAALKLLEQLPVKNRAVFDDLGHAVGKSFRRQQGEHVRIADDKRRLPERPDKIFSLWDINPGLASNG